MKSWEELRQEQRDPGMGVRVHLLNTSIIPSGCDGTWEVTTLDFDAARMVLNRALADGDVGAYGDMVHSHIGHESTAQQINLLFGGRYAEVDRTPWDGTGFALVYQVHGRLPEGKILTLEELQAIGYSWRLLHRAAPNFPTKYEEKENANLAKPTGGPL